MRYRLIDSPVGPLTLAVNGDGVLCGVYAEGQKYYPDTAALGVRDDAVAEDAVVQLTGYFAGVRTAFDLPLAPRGTAFQRRVWQALTGIPAGETRSYGEIAAALGSPGASRAVGAATGRNPISIIVPCHRLVGASGSLTGYAGGIERKRWLLDHEAAGVQREGVLMREDGHAGAGGDPERIA